MTAESGGIAEERGDGRGRSVPIARNGGFRPGGMRLRRPLATHLGAWGIENWLAGDSKRVIIPETAGGGRQRTHIWEMSVYYPSADTSGQNAVAFQIGGNPTWSNENKFLDYLTDSEPAGQEGPTAYYNNIIQGGHKPPQTNNYNVDFQQKNDYWSQPPETPFVVATTPEPATLTLLALGGLGLLKRRLK